MRDIGFFGFVAALLMLGFKRPFLFICAYIYIDIVAPQRISYVLLSGMPISLICFVLAIGGWLVTDDKRDMRIAPRQIMMLVLLGYCAMTTFYMAAFPVEALEKWDWVWKSMAFAIFLPLALRTKLRIESALLFLLLSLAAIVIGAGIKTVLGGSGYGSFAMMVDDNSGIYEDSTLSAAAISAIPLILWFTRHGTIFPPNRYVRWFCYALIFACLLTPIGTQARTGLVCIALLAIVMLRDVKRKGVFIAAAAIAGMIALPLLPSAFSQRMGTISNYQADESAGTRLAVWRWTFHYTQDHPLGGGFDAYRGNSLTYYTRDQTDRGAVATVNRRLITDRGRAYHSSYFEMMGEQGWFGLGLWLAIHLGGLLRMEVLRRRYRRDRAKAGEEWVAPLATALQQAHVVFMLGAAFVGIAFQPIFLYLIAIEIGFDSYLSRLRKQEARKPLVERLARPGQPEAGPEADDVLASA